MLNYNVFLHSSLDSDYFSWNNATVYSTFPYLLEFFSYHNVLQSIEMITFHLTTKKTACTLYSLIYG